MKILHTNAWSGETGNELVVKGTFDNVFTNAFLYDDFNTPFFPGDPNVFINDLKWIQDEDWPGQDPGDFSPAWTSRRISDGPLELTVQNTGLGRVTVDTDIPQENHTNFLQADVTLDPATFNSGFDAGIPHKDRGEVRLQGFRFNALHDGSDANPYDGEEGEVFVMVRIESRGDGEQFARALMGQCEDASCDNSTVFQGSRFSCEVSPGSPNTLGLEKIGNTFLFSCDGEILSYTYTGNVFESQWGDTRRIRARVNSTPDKHGYLQAYVDNIYTTKSAWSIYLPVIINGSQQQ